MGNKTPQVDSGFIMIATGNYENDIFTAMARARFSGTEYQCLLVIIRKTWGFKKKADWISLNQFTTTTSRSKSAVISALNTLVRKNVLVRKTTPGVRSIYSFNKDFNTWKILVRKTIPVRKTAPTSTEFRTPLVRKTGHTKETITKETIQKKDYVPVGDFLTFFNFLFKSKYIPTKQRQVKLKSRLQTYSYEQIKQAVTNMANDKFYRGENDRNWKADPDFILRSDEQIDRFLNRGTQFRKPLQI